MTSRSGRGRWQRVLEAREQARGSLGLTQGNLPYDAPPPRRVGPGVPRAILPAHRENPDEPSVVVLSIGEAADRLGIDGDELEEMIAAGKVQALPTGFTRTIPLTEIERIGRLR